MKFLVRLRQQKFALWFVLLLLLTYGFTGIYEVLPLRPQSVHQWAQTDRASVALRYYQEGMNFFLPRVHNIANGTGITGMEFPIINYSVAILYKLFGYNEWLYRLLMLSIITAGLMATAALARRILHDPVWAALLTLIWFLSPVLVFYSANFLPDTASLGLIMIGWLAFFKLKDRFSVKWLTILFISASLASLIKIVSAISIIAMLLIIGLYHLKFIQNKTGQEIYNKKNIVAGMLLLALALTAAWYGYANYLNKEYLSGFFLLQARPAPSLMEFLRYAKGAAMIWGPAYYSLATLIAIAAAAISSLIFRKKVDRLLLIISWLVFLGSLAYYLLMSFQFRDHDYYIIALLPAGYFFLLLITDYLKKQKSLIRNLTLAGLAILFLVSAVYARNMHKERYKATPGFSAYFDLEPYLDSLQISQKDIIYSAYDESFNISLYLSNRQGHTLSPYLPEEYHLFHLYLNIDYAVINDTSFIQFPSIKQVLGSRIGEHKGLSIYRVELPHKERAAFFSWANELLEPMTMRIKSNSTWHDKVLHKARKYGLPADWLIIREAINLYPLEVNNHVTEKAKDIFPELLTKEGKVSYAGLNSAERQKLEEDYKQGIFDDYEMQLIKMDVNEKFAKYGTGDL
ncbi:MAG: glycosyltransferase family 39 protein [Bacteroidia bacterium]